MPVPHLDALSSMLVDMIHVGFHGHHDFREHYFSNSCLVLVLLICVSSNLNPVHPYSVFC